MTEKANLRTEVAAIRKALDQLAKSSERMVADIVEAGRWLTRAKEKVEHGHWGQWLRENFDLSEDTSENYRRVYRLSTRPGFQAAAKNLPLEVLYALGRSGVTEDVREAAFARAAEGERISLSALRTTTSEPARPANPVYLTAPAEITSQPYDWAARRVMQSLRDVIAAVRLGTVSVERLAAQVSEEEAGTVLEDLDAVDDVVLELRKALQGPRRRPNLRVVERENPKPSEI